MGLIRGLHGDFGGARPTQLCPVPRWPMFHEPSETLIKWAGAAGPTLARFACLTVRLGRWRENQRFPPHLGAGGAGLPSLRQQVAHSGHGPRLRRLPSSPEPFWWGGAV